MKRSVRNGIAIAGMVGGFWLLGQAVASASDQVADAGADTTSSQVADGSGGDATNANGSLNGSSAENVSVTDVDTDVNGGDAGSNSADVNTGVQSGGAPANSEVQTLGTPPPPPPPASEINIETGDVSVNQEANGGDVSDSGNVAVGGSGDQSATANATTTVDQNATSEGSGKWSSDEANNANLSGNFASAENKSITRVETDVDGGDGGYNSAYVNTGLQGTLYCGEKNDCVIYLDTGDIHLNQEANGGSVWDSGNVAVSGTGDQNSDADASTSVNQNATSESDTWKWLSRDEAGNFNLSGNFADASNVRIIRVETDVDGGDGGSNTAYINTGIIGDLYCEKGGCIYYITTGDVWLNQEANGGDVNGSGNVSSGIEKPVKEEQPGTTIVPPAQQAPAQPAPVKVVTVVTALPTAQPSGQLAFTGADVSAPLALGLLALGAGAGLTALGRRRTATAA